MGVAELCKANGPVGPCGWRTCLAHRQEYKFGRGRDTDSISMTCLAVQPTWDIRMGVLHEATLRDQSEAFLLCSGVAVQRSLSSSHLESSNSDGFDGIAVSMKLVPNQNQGDRAMLVSDNATKPRTTCFLVFVIHTISKAEDKLGRSCCVMLGRSRDRGPREGGKHDGTGAAFVGHRERNFVSGFQMPRLRWRT